MFGMTASFSQVIETYEDFLLPHIPHDPHIDDLDCIVCG